MALNFPDSPTIGQTYYDTTSGFFYEWDGTVWKSYTSSTTNQIKILDDISGSFDDVTQIFSLTVGGTAITPSSPQSLIINLGGVIQSPGVDYSVSGTSIIFSTAPSNGLSFSGISLGPAVPVNTVNDGSITPVKLSTGGPSWNTNGDVTITGTGSTALLVKGNARVTGILTVGTSSITLDGTTSVVTADAFIGDGSGLTGVGVGSSDSINTTGIVTASYFSGEGISVTGIVTASSIDTALQILTFSPTDGATDVSPVPNIVLTFNQGVVKGTGNIELRDSSGIGTVLQTIGVTSTSVSISGAQVSIAVTGPLPISKDVYTVIPSGAFKNIYETPYGGTSTYNFTITNDAVTTYSPANESINVGYSESIILTFPFAPKRGTGTVELRSGSPSGTIIETFDALTSNRISVSGNQWIVDPTQIFSASIEVFLVIPSTAIVNYDGLNIGGTTKSYSFTIKDPTDLSIVPANNSTNVGLTTNITISFDNTPIRGTGTIEIRANEATGTLVESFDAATSDRITIVGNDWILNPTIDLPAGTLVYVIIPSTALVGFPGLTIGGDTEIYGFTLIGQSSFSWGRNQFGQLGQNNQTSYSSPIQIPGTTWSSISGGNQHSLATKSDGTLWAWGLNQFGQLGQNNRTYYSSPIQIPGTTWSSIESGNQHSLALQTTLL